MFHKGFREVVSEKNKGNYLQVTNIQMTFLNRTKWDFSPSEEYLKQMSMIFP